MRLVVAHLDHEPNDERADITSKTGRTRVSDLIKKFSPVKNSVSHS